MRYPSIQIRLSWLLCPLVACSAGDPMTGTTAGSSGGASTGALDTTSHTSGSGTSTTSPIGTDTSVGSTLADSSEGSGDSSTGEGLGSVLVTTTFEIPAGTVVQEFTFEAEGFAGFGAGTPIVVAFRDLTHPDREQGRLCPSDHPLDGCATVDYGAFGMIHDNRIVVEGGGGPLELHLYKDRSIATAPEPLLISE